MRAGVFVTGTDTGVGKTVVSACLVRRWRADYWKPVQTGLAEDEADTVTVARLSGAAVGRMHSPRHSFQAPLSPEAAASAEDAQVSLADFSLPAGGAPVVVEGAGGVLVPLGGGALMVDLMVELGLPVLLVSRTALGTINHTLLSLECLRARNLTVWGVVMVGTDNPANAEAIARLGRVAVLARLATMPVLTEAAISRAAEALPASPPQSGAAPAGACAA